MAFRNGLTQLKDVQANLATTIELMEEWSLKCDEMEKKVHALTEENRRLKASGKKLVYFTAQEQELEKLAPALERELNKISPDEQFNLQAIFSPGARKDPSAILLYAAKSTGKFLETFSRHTFAIMKGSSSKNMNMVLAVSNSSSFEGVPFLPSGDRVVEFKVTPTGELDLEDEQTVDAILSIRAFILTKR